MTVKNIIDDISRLTTNTASVVFESSKEMGEKLKSQVKSILTSMDLVSREEFEALKELCQKQSAEIEALKSKIK
jgi:BMFP domain-containing protein YqiC